MRKKLTTILISYGISALLLSGCSLGESLSSPGGATPGSSGGFSLPGTGSQSGSQSGTGTSGQTSVSSGAGTRDNTPVVLTPEAPGTVLTDNDSASIDCSNSSEGYFMAKYTGDNEKVKLQLTCPDDTTYTYNLVSDDYVAFPFSSGDGTYSIVIYENISGFKYSACLSTKAEVTLADEFRPFLYPNQYCQFDTSCDAVSKGCELVASAGNDLEAVTAIYNYIIANISYDYDKAESIESGEIVSYISDVDSTLERGTGICLDYAAIMTAMLRSQGIPTRLEVGNAGTAYHAWISTYLKEIGWVNGIVEFDGVSWKLMDPTFASTNTEKALKKYIGDGSNYTVKYMY